jgi:hypothetical protein
VDSMQARPHSLYWLVRLDPEVEFGAGIASVSYRASPDRNQRKDFAPSQHPHRDLYSGRLSIIRAFLYSIPPIPSNEQLKAHPSGSMSFSPQLRHFFETVEVPPQ